MTLRHTVPVNWRFDSSLFRIFARLRSSTEGRRHGARNDRTCSIGKIFRIKNILSPQTAFPFVIISKNDETGTKRRIVPRAEYGIPSMYRVYIIRQLEDPTNWCRQAIVRIERKESFLPFSLANFHPLASSQRNENFVEMKDRPDGESRAYKYILLLKKKKKKTRKDIRTYTRTGETEKENEREWKKRGINIRRKWSPKRAYYGRTRSWLGVIVAG